MSSAICQNFVQNAWKKELCSNCFKSKDEHAEKPKPKPIQLISNDKVEGIIKNGKKFKPKLTVCFLKDLTEIIGYGGEDWCSENEEADDNNDSSDDDYTAESEEEESAKELQRLTKENTDFNTTSLREITEVKKTYSQLLLGKPLVDASGKKQTLLVSVTPFGEDSSSTPTRRYGTKPLSHIPIAKNNKDVVAEIKTNVVLTSYTKNGDEKFLKEEKSLLDEITETLENSKNPIQIIAKKTQKQSDETDSNKENESRDTAKEKDTEVKEETIKAETKSVVTEKKVSLSRTPALKRDTEKPVIFQTATAKIELLNTKNLKFNKEAVNNSKVKSEVNNNEKKDSIQNKNEKTELTNNTLSSSNLIKSEIMSSRAEICDTKEKKDEINTTVAEKSCVEEKEKVTNLPPIVPSKFPMPFPQSREQAGKPDGREDPVIAELPPLPITPPPVLETQTSFLHSTVPPIYEKPKIPSKPSTVLIRKPMTTNHHLNQPQTLSTFSNDKSIEKTPLSKQDSTDSDMKGNKRRAPMPPEETMVPIYARNSAGMFNLESSIVRDQDKRERASSCIPKMGVIDHSMDEGDYSTPEPAPRKSLSVSVDSLATTGDEKRKEKQKGRFSLKKFLRMGSSKDLPKLTTENTSIKIEENDGIPQPKPRLVIVHPSELNGAKVEVVAKPLLEQSSYHKMDYHSHHEYEAYNSPKAAKPPPPPRNHVENGLSSKPNLPHPPKSVEILNKQRQISRSNSTAKKTETVYANIGEVRSAMVPNKPVRTASMREREAQQQKQMRKHLHNYEPINIRGKDNSENVYDYINNSGRSSSPDSDSSREKGSPKGVDKVIRLGKRSESSIDVSGEYFKYSNIPRSMSLTYCGSETESEIYSPYSFYGSESEVTEDDHDWIQNGRTHKLRSRKGRSIVHKNLEDNYGAVVVANHEALAQVLENIHQTNHVPLALRGLKTSPNLRWTDFSMKSGTTPVVIGRRVFHQALWGAQHVTLVVNVGTVTSSTLPLGTFNLTPVTEFSDLVPSSYLAHSVGNEDNKQVQATISVLPWLQVNTIQSFSDLLKSKEQNHEDMWKDANFIMLQLVNALKTLQAQGIEELPLDMDSFVLCKEMDRDTHHRLCVLQELASDVAGKTDQEQGTLCTCALRALNYLQTLPKITPLIQSLLNKERAVSLTQVKSILEFSLWGPSDVCLGTTIRERELALQRWLDLQRATVLHGLVCTRVQLTVYEECHLLFLVRSNARMMSDASLLIESSNMKHSVANAQK